MPLEWGKVNFYEIYSFSNIFCFLLYDGQSDSDLTLEVEFVIVYFLSVIFFYVLFGVDGGGKSIISIAGLYIKLIIRFISLKVYDSGKD